MESRHLRMILRHAVAAAGCPNGAKATDAELLDRFRRNRDEAAFAELVHRYGRLVWAVCRNLVAADADASDAFQATFLALVQHADQIRDPARLVSWLHGVAYRVCSKSRRQAQRRNKRERQVAVSEIGHSVPDSAWDRAMSAVHEEVSRLPEYLRVPFVLCCLEGKGATEAAEQLGWKLGTLSGRLTRAKARLLASLDRRGLAIGAAAAVTAGASAYGKVPPVVAERAINLICHGVLIPSSIMNLSQGVVGMTVYRTKLLVAVLGILAIGLTTSVGSGWLARADAQGKDDVRNRALEAVEKFKHSQPTWEYKYEPVAVEAHPAGFADATRQLEVNAGEGWEFCGTMEMSLSSAEFQKLSRGAGKPSASGVYRVSVYKRPAQAGLKKKLESTAAQKGLEELSRLVEEEKRNAIKRAQAERDYRRAIEEAQRALREKPDASAQELKERTAADDAKKRAAEEFQRALGLKKEKASLEAELQALRAEIEQLKLKSEKLELERQSLEKLRGSLSNKKVEAEALERAAKAANVEAFERAKKIAESLSRAKKPSESLEGTAYKLKSSVQDSDYMIKLAVAAAQKKFGKGSVDVSLDTKDPKAQQILITGQPDAVKWMINLLKKLEE